MRLPLAYLGMPFYPKIYEAIRLSKYASDMVVGFEC